MAEDLKLTDAEAAVLVLAGQPAHPDAILRSLRLRGLGVTVGGDGLDGAACTNLGKQALAAYEQKKREEIRKEVIAECGSVLAVGYHDDEYGPGMAQAQKLLGDLARGGPSPHASLGEAVAAQIAEIERPLREKIAELESEVYDTRAAEMRDLNRVAEIEKPLRERIARLEKECDRLTRWLRKIDGGDSPCFDESQLRQWAYEAVTLEHEPGEESNG